MDCFILSIIKFNTLIYFNTLMDRFDMSFQIPIWVRFILAGFAFIYFETLVNRLDMKFHISICTLLVLAGITFICLDMIVDRFNVTT